MINSLVFLIEFLTVNTKLAETAVLASKAKAAICL